MYAYVYICIHMYAYAVHACSVYEVRRHQVPWNWSYRELGATMWVLGIKPQSSGGAAASAQCS